MLKKILGTWTLLFCLCMSVFAGELDIPKEKRVKNFPSGCCGWCSIENLGNVHGIAALKGLALKRHNQHESLIEVTTSELIESKGIVQVTRFVKRGDAPATAKSITKELTDLKVNFKIQSENSKDTKIITESVNAEIGCAIGVRDWPRQGDYHMVTLTDLTDKTCVFVENRDDCARYAATREWFDEHWSGLTVVIYPEKKKIK
jgi:RNA polymerase subunit RPABC4/transcription elongation factor Spt4